MEGGTARAEGLATPVGFASRIPARLSSLLRQPASVPVGLLLLAALVYLPHVITGGFISDDWEYEAYARVPRSLGAMISLLAPRTNHGELHAVYQVVVHRAFAGSMPAHMIWLCGLAAATAVAFYYLLRAVGAGRLGAAWMAAATLLMPLAAATHLWVTAGAGALSLLLALIGGLSAVRGLRLQGARGALLHVAALGCYAASMLVYEATAPLIAVSLFVYLMVAPWRRAVVPWLLDVCVVIGVLVHVASLSTLARTPTSALPGHALHLARTAVESGLAAGFVLPPRARLQPWHYALLAMSLALVLGLVALALKSSRENRPAIRRSFAIIAAGVAAVAAAYSIFVPSRYDPLTSGLELRLNVVAVLGFAIAFYGVGRLALAALPERIGSGVSARGIVAALACAVLAAYIVKAEVDTHSYAKAASYTSTPQEQRAILRDLTPHI